MTSPNTRARAPLAGASLRLLGGRHQGFVVLPSRGGGERGEKFFSGKLAGAFTAKECPCTVCLLTFFANGEYELDKTRPRSEALVREGHVARPGGSGEEGGSAPVRPEVRSFVRVRTTTPRGVYVGAGCFSPPHFAAPAWRGLGPNFYDLVLSQSGVVASGRKPTIQLAFSWHTPKLRSFIL